MSKTVYTSETRDPITGTLCAVRFGNTPDAGIVPWVTDNETTEEGFAARRAELEGDGFWVAEEQRPRSALYGTNARNWHVLLWRAAPKAKLGEKVTFMSRHNDTLREVKGQTVLFPDWPALGVTLVVFQDPRNKFYYVAEQSTGLKCGSNGEKRRADALRHQWLVLESMRLAKNHGGSHESVARFVADAVARAKATPATAT